MSSLMTGWSCSDQGMAWSCPQRSFPDWGNNPNDFHDIVTWCYFLSLNYVIWVNICTLQVVNIVKIEFEKLAQVNIDLFTFYHYLRLHILNYSSQISVLVCVFDLLLSGSSQGAGGGKTWWWIQGPRVPLGRDLQSDKMKDSLQSIIPLGSIGLGFWSKKKRKTAINRCQCNGGLSWNQLWQVIRPAEKLEGRSLLVADLTNKLGR